MVRQISYSAEEDARLWQHYPTATKAELQALFPGRSLRGLAVRASRLGVHKNHDAWEVGIPCTGSVGAHLSEVDKAYLAGIIDGEGCIMLQRRIPKGKRNPTYTLFLSITNTSPQLIAWLNEKLRGRCYNTVTAHTNPKHRTKYEWILAGNRQVMAFLKDIAPYLVIKREQAELLMNGYVHLPEEERYALFLKMRALKKTA